jgi:hypothetical protein
MSNSPENGAALKGAAHELNPRKITPQQLKAIEDSHKAYGDLSGVIFNRRTRKQRGGHQRVKIIQGTVGIGYVISKNIGRIPYREVDWPVEKEMAAMIAANSHGGEWEESLLRKNLILISEAEGENEVDAGTLGLQDEFMEKLMRNADLTLNVQEQESKSLQEPLTVSEVKNLPSQTAMLQLFYTIQTRPAIVERWKKLQILLGTANISDTAEAVSRFAESHKEALQDWKELDKKKVDDTLGL